MRIVDAHCHVGFGVHQILSPADLIADMDGHQVDMAVVCPVDKFIAGDWKAGNRYILDIVKEFPDRLIGFAVVNPWYGHEAVDELRRVVDQGLRGLKINSSLQGFLINDELIYPVIEVAEELALPVYVHTGTPVQALPFQLAHLAAQFPRVNFIMGHVGWPDFSSEGAVACKQSDNIYVDTTYSARLAALEMRIRDVGPRRVIFASDSPVSNIAVELSKLLRLSWDNETRDDVLGANILRLVNGVK